MLKILEDLILLARERKNNPVEGSYTNKLLGDKNLAKEKVLEFIIDKYPDIEIQYTKHGNPKPGTLDMCDSIVIALAGDKLVREAQTT